MKVTALTTFRGVDPHRVNNLESVVRHLSTGRPDWEILVVEQDGAPKIGGGSTMGGTRHVFVNNRGPFNKSWGINVGFRQSRGEFLVVCDADMIVKMDDLDRAIWALQKGLDIVRPYSTLIDLDEPQTARYHGRGILPAAPRPGRGYDRGYAGEHLCLAGGIFVIRRGFFEAVGGMDERFVGWGGEDDAFSIKVRAMTGKSAIARDALAWHLWHPRADVAASDNYAGNVRLLREYRSSGAGGFSQTDPATIGLADKYAEPCDQGR